MKDYTNIFCCPDSLYPVVQDLDEVEYSSNYNGAKMPSTNDNSRADIS